MDDSALPPGSLRLAPGVSVPAGAVTFTAARAGGPGGQNVNNTSSKIELRLRLEDIAGLGPGALRRCADLAGSRLIADGTLILACDETRSARANKEMVVERLRDLVREALVVPKARRRTRPGRGAIERRLEGKARTSERKRQRREPGD